MTEQIIITGDNGRQAAVELRSFTDNVADLFRAEDAAPAGHGVSLAEAKAQGIIPDAVLAEGEKSPEPAEAVEEAPKKRGPYKKRNSN